MALYQKFPELTWTGLDIKGALAVVETASGEKTQEEKDISDSPRDTVASKSGYIKEVITPSRNADGERRRLCTGRGRADQLGGPCGVDSTYDESRNDLVTYVKAEGDVTAVVVYALETQFAKGKFSEEDMTKLVEKAVRNLSGRKSGKNRNHQERFEVFRRRKYNKM